MKGRTTFSRDEIDAIKDLLKRKERATPSAQKGLRQRIRDKGFFISDFEDDKRGFTARDLDRLIENGAISVQ